MLHSAAHESMGGSQIVTIAELENALSPILRQLSQLNVQNSRIHFPQSSQHDSGYNDVVCAFYGNGRVCCLSGFKDPGVGGGTVNILRVVAAHIIPTSCHEMLAEINRDKSKEFLNFTSPREAILLQKKWEVLFDRYCWCLVPAIPLEHSAKFKVCVFATAEKPQLEFIYSSINKSLATREDLEVWVSELGEFDGKIIEFAEGKVPSHRALSVHRNTAVTLAEQLGWINEYTAEQYRVLQDLSPPRSS